MSELVSNWYHGPVTALCPALHQTHVLIGQGQFVSLHSLKDSVKNNRNQKQVLKASVVHSIELLRSDEAGELYVVRGGKSVATIKITTDHALEIVEPECVQDDWIISSRVAGDNVWLLTAHNRLHRHGSSDQGTAGPGGPCILYSGFLHCPTSDHVIVMAGTVFGKVLIWDSVSGDMINTLQGHDGVIFSVNYANGVIVTTSDDRSSIVYRVRDDIMGEVEQVHRLYGHTARVFRSLIMGDTSVVTAGEDGRLISWCQTTGAELARQEPHAGSAVWSVASVSGHLVSGGGDGSVSVTTLINDIQTNTTVKMLTIKFNQLKIGYFQQSLISNRSKIAKN